MSRRERPAGPPILAVEGVNLSLRARSILRDVSIEVHPGQMVVLLGPSGCGKTTLLRSIAGLAKPQSGRISIRGVAQFDAERRLFAPPEARGVSMVFQSYALWPHMTLARNVAYPLRSRRIPRDEVGPRVEAALRAVGLGELGERFPAEVSGGQQQRAALARAIVAEVDIILFDEPLSNVDARMRHQIREEITALQRRLGFAAVYVTHDQAEACALADWLVLMETGTIVQQGEAAAVYDTPVSLSVARYMGPTNEFNGVMSNAGRLETEIGPIAASGVPAADDVAGVAWFRPEACRLSRVPVEGPNTWRCRVERLTFLGASAEATLVGSDCAGLRVTAAVERGLHAEGDEVWLRVPHERISFFPDATR